MAAALAATATASAPASESESSRPPAHAGPSSVALAHPRLEPDEVLRAYEQMDHSIALLERASCTAGAAGATREPSGCVRRAHGASRASAQPERLLPEAEGSDALLFSTVPGWIRMTRVRGCRYRKVTAIDDSGDETDALQLGISFLGYPGGSGWAEKIGDVAIHYISPHWAVFSKVFPFPEQAESRALHEDLLLLGAAKDVFQTPSCVLRVGPSGVTDSATPVRLITSEGVREVQTTVSSLSRFAQWRLHLTWGHEREPYSVEVAHFYQSKDALELELEESYSWARRMYLMLLRLQGRLKVGEELHRYPAAPIDPAYYHRLLSVSCVQTPDEIDARALFQARPSEAYRREHLDSELTNNDDVAARHRPSLVSVQEVECEMSFSNGAQCHEAQQSEDWSPRSQPPLSA